jgi:hypothetical protein
MIVFANDRFFSKCLIIRFGLKQMIVSLAQMIFLRTDREFCNHWLFPEAPGSFGLKSLRLKSLRRKRLQAFSLRLFNLKLFSLKTCPFETFQSEAFQPEDVSV